MPRFPWWRATSGSSGLLGEVRRGAGVVPPVAPVAAVGEGLGGEPHGERLGAQLLGPGEVLVLPERAGVREEPLDLGLLRRAELRERRGLGGRGRRGLRGRDLGRRGLGRRGLGRGRRRRDLRLVVGLDLGPLQGDGRRGRGLARPDGQEQARRQEPTHGHPAQAHEGRARRAGGPPPPGAPVAGAGAPLVGAAWSQASSASASAAALG